MLFPYDTWGQVKAVFIISIIRYILIAGTAFFMFYVVFKHKAVFDKIQQRWPAKTDYAREIFYSILTFIIFAATPLILNNHHVKPFTSIYNEIDRHGMLYFWMVFPLMLLVHDTYFYWTHRLMHHPRLFRFFHVVHHKSTNPSPWASFSFQPTEAVIESGIIYVFAFTFPVHLIHIFIFLVFMTMYNVYGHLGFELYPKGFNRHWLGKWLNTSVNHNMHHQYFKGNYGLYFTWWDRLMKTTHTMYNKRFDEVTGANHTIRQIKKQHAV